MTISNALKLTSLKWMEAEEVPTGAKSDEANELDSYEVFGSKILDRRWSMTPYNSPLEGAIRTLEIVKELYGDKQEEFFNSPRDHLENVVESVISYDYRYQLRNGMLNSQGKQWRRDVLEFLGNTSTRHDLALVRDCVDCLFKLKGTENYYELLVNPDSPPLERVYRVLFRRAVLLQWRCFWISSTECTGEAETFNRISNKLRDSYCIRRSKRDVPEISSQLPEMKVRSLTVRLDSRTTQMHKEVLEEFREAWTKFSRERFISGDSAKNVSLVLVVLTKWRQVVTLPELVTMNTPLLKDEQGAEVTHHSLLKRRFREGLTGYQINDPLHHCIAGEEFTPLREKIPSIAPTSPKIERILHYIEGCREKGEKVIVFSGWTSFLLVLREHIINHNYGVEMIDGSQTLRQRNSLVEQYQTDERITVLLASIKACGVGLNLTVAQHVLFCEPSWNPFGEELQAMQRIHRIGQTRDTHARFLVAELSDGRESIDSYVRYLQDSKMSQAQSVLGDSYLDRVQQERVGRVKGENKGKLARLASFVK